MGREVPFDTIEEAARLFTLVEAAKKEWETTFDAFEDGIGILNRDGTFKRANVALATLVGRDVRELPGMRCCELFTHHKTMGCPSRLQAGHREVEVEISSPWRRVYRESAYAVPGLDSVVVIVSDITAQRLAEERIRKLHEEALMANRELVSSVHRLRETQERLLASEKLASLATMAAGLAHEINNPLSFVASGVRQLGDWTKRLIAFVAAFDGGATKSDLDRRVKEDGLLQASAEVKAIIADVQQGIDRITRIVKALSNFVDQGALAVAEVDVNAIVEEVVAEVQEGLPQGVTIATACADLPHVETSESGLRTVLRQLLENAIWAVEGVDRPGRVVVGTSIRDDMVVVTVQDNGCGMSPDVVSRAMDPFFTSRAPGPHVGLGLTIAQSVVRRMGGNLTLRSEAGVGTIVEFTIPLEHEMSFEISTVSGPASRT